LQLSLVLGGRFQSWIQSNCGRVVSLVATQLERLLEVRCAVEAIAGDASDFYGRWADAS
jgi:hypothetical protein